MLLCAPFVVCCQNKIRNKKRKEKQDVCLMSVESKFCSWDVVDPWLPVSSSATSLSTEECLSFRNRLRSVEKIITLNCCLPKYTPHCVRTSWNVSAWSTLSIKGSITKMTVVKFEQVWTARHSRVNVWSECGWKERCTVLWRWCKNVMSVWEWQSTSTFSISVGRCSVTGQAHPPVYTYSWIFKKPQSFHYFSSPWSSISIAIWSKSMLPKPTHEHKVNKNFLFVQPTLLNPNLNKLVRPTKAGYSFGIFT